MKSLQVVAAIIQDGDTFLATQRGYGDWKGWWEFPGGKIKQGESAETALKREILEELEMRISVGEQLCTIQTDYPEFHLTMHCFLCKIQEGEPVLREHEALRWLKLEEMDAIRWLSADVEAIEKLKERFQETTV